MEASNVAKKKAKKSAAPAFTPRHARWIIDAHDLDVDDPEESEMLRENNPDLYEAYEALKAFAHSADTNG